MRNSTSKRFRHLIAVLSAALCLFINGQIVLAQEINGPGRMNDLGRLRDRLKDANPLNDSDIVMIMNERVISEAAQRLVGLEVEMSHGEMLRVTSVQTELIPGAAYFRIGVQARSPIKINVQLYGQLNSGEFEMGSLRLPMKITEVKLGNGGISSLFMKTIFSEWLNPKTWDKKLPAINLPMEIGEMMKIPAGHFDVMGDLPMEISTPEYQAPLKLTVTSVFALNKRAVVSLRLSDKAQAMPIAVAYDDDAGAPKAPGAKANELAENERDPAEIEKDSMAMQNEIERLSEGLYLNGDFRAIVSRRLINTMLAEISEEHNVDLSIHLKEGRIRSEEINVVVNVKNYTDVEGGDGHADLTRLSIDNIADGKATLRLAGNGEVDARIRGSEFGVSYSVSPHMTFSIKDQFLPMEFGSEGKKIFMRAAPGSTLPIDLQFNLKLGGHDLRLSRKSVAQADKWLKRVELPSFFDREISIPRRILIDSGGHPHIMDSQKLDYMLSNMRIEAKDDSLEITADVKINQPTIPSMMNPQQ